MTTFFPNGERDIDPQEPNLLKTPRKVNVAWKNRKRVLGYLINTLTLIFTIPTYRLQKVRTATANFPPVQRRTSHRKWARLVGIFKSITPDLTRGRYIFAHLKAYSNRGHNQIRLYTTTHTELVDWCALVGALAS